MKILNFGSMNYDYVYAVPRIVKGGETLTTTGMETFLGGKGFNQSVALIKAGAFVYHAGFVGEDGEEFIEACKRYGIQTDYVRKIKGRSGHTIIQVDREAQNCILLYPGANRKLTKKYIDEVLADFESGDFLILQNEMNEVDYIIEKAYEIGMIIVLNPSPYNGFMEACDLNKVNYFIMNEVEGEQITGEKDPEKIVTRMLENYPKAKIVLTLGKDGSMYRDADTEYHQPIFPVKAIDTTAAGDTFTGYFVASVLDGGTVLKSLELGAKAAAITVTRAGASPSIPYKSEVE
ncbi:MAG: ribokinase [Lachnospiraceae bacterium]